MSINQFIVDVKLREFGGTSRTSMRQYRAKPQETTQMARNPLTFKCLKETGCVVPVTHKLNSDGYFRKRLEHTNRLVMFHVYVWELANERPVPEGCEVHHICGNRACCNPQHLELMEGRAHAARENRERYAPRFEAAFHYWQKHRCTGTELGKKFGVSVSTGCRWVRLWNTEGVETILQGSRGTGEIPVLPEARSMESHHAP